MRKWKQGLTSLLAVAMVGAACPAVFAAETPTAQAGSNVVAGVWGPATGTVDSTTVNPDISVWPSTDNTFDEGIDGLPAYFVGTGEFVKKGTQVMVRDGAPNYFGGALSYSNYITIYTLSFVNGNHAVLALNGVDAVDINARDVVPIAYTAIPTNLDVTVNGVDVGEMGKAMPTYYLDYKAQDPGCYVRLQDIANVLSNTNANFAIGTSNGVHMIAHGWVYTPDNTENVPCFPGNGYAVRKGFTFLVDKNYYNVTGISIVDYNGFEHIYFRLSDLEHLLGVDVSYVGHTIDIATI